MVRYMAFILGIASVVCLVSIAAIVVFFWKIRRLLRGWPGCDRS